MRRLVRSPYVRKVPVQSTNPYARAVYLEKTLTKKIAEANMVIALAQSLKVPQGKVGPQGPAGKDANIQSVITAVLRKIPVPKDGKDGKDGRDGKDAEVDIDQIVSLVQASIPPLVIDRAAIVAEVEKGVLERLAKEKPRKFKVKDIEDLNPALESMLRRYGAYIHGGGDTVAAGSGVTIVVNSDGTKVISATGSGTQVATQVVTGVQAGSDVTIALSQLTNFATYVAPVILVMRNQIPQTLGVTYTETATEVTVLNADAGEIFAIMYAFT